MLNYSVECEKILNNIKKSEEKPTLLLHACCAPCSSYSLEYLSPFFVITLFFYNPNISPEGEFIFRLNELERFNREAGYNCPIITPNYDSNEFFSVTSSLSSLPEGGERCRICYDLRLKKTAEAAQSLGFDYFSTTLSISPHKNANWLNEIGLSYQTEQSKYLPSDLKKKNGYKRSIELSREYNLYRQSYCGCVYSKNAREITK